MFAIVDCGTYFCCMADGSRFYYTSGSKEAAFTACQQHAANLQAVIQKRLGRPLTAKELRVGSVEHKDRRGVTERLEQTQKWAAVFAPDSDPAGANPFALQLQAYENEKARKLDPKGYELTQLAKKWDAEQKAMGEQEARDNDGARKDVVKMAQARLTGASFDPRIELNLVIDAENLVRLAKTGNLALYHTLADGWKVAYETVLRDAAAPARARLAREQAEVEKLTSGIFDIQEPNQ